MMQAQVDQKARKRSRREFLRTAVGRAQEEQPALGIAAAMASTEVAGALVPPPVVWEDVRLRLLRRATYGLSNVDVLDIRNQGYQYWLNNQVNYERIDVTAFEANVAARWPMLSQTPAELAAANSGTLRTALQDAALYRAAFSPRQLYERMVEFWTDHFNISYDKVGYLQAVDIREVIRKHAMGKFSDMLKASAKSPAMLAYLDQNFSRVGAPNQNYARELMELHTVGVDGGYTQQDVVELSRVLTGWTFAGAGEFSFNASRHDFGAKTVMGLAIAATPTTTGAAAIAEGEQVLEFLLRHPSTGRYLAKRMLMWLVTPTPTDTQIEAIAGAYRATGGDIKRMVRAVLNEGWIGAAPLKFKRPFHLAAGALRASGAVVNSVTSMSSQVSNMGQPLYRYETPDGYPDLVEYWVGNLMPRWSFANTLSTSTSQTNTNLDIAAYLAGTADASIDRMNTELFGGEMSASTRSALLAYVQAGTFNSTRIRETLGLALSSFELQWY